MVNGLEFFQRKEIKDVLAYLQLLNNPHDEVALLRVINTPARGIGKTTIDRLAGHAARHGMTLLEAARQVRQHRARSTPAAPSWSAGFVALFDRLAAVAGGPIEELLGYVLTETGYEEQWQASGDEEDEERLANIEELLTVAREFDERHRRRGPPGGISGRDRAWSTTPTTGRPTPDRVTLMTLHASKGLEFPVVYLVAVEEGLLPHERSRSDARPGGRGAAADVRGHHPGAAGAADQHGAVPRFPRRAEADRPQLVPDGIAAGRNGRARCGPWARQPRPLSPLPFWERDRKRCPG